MNLKETVEFIFERGKKESNIIEIGDERYAPSALQLKQIHPDPLPPAPPLIPEFRVQTLSGLVSLIKEGVDQEADLLVHIVDETTVNLVTKNVDAWMRRSILVACNAFEYQQFPFGRQMSQEDFIINFMTRFVADDSSDSDYSYVLRIAQGLTSSVVSTSDDDGISQEVTVRQGIHGRKPLEVKRRVKLAPFRTFTEVEQPSSDFLFRLHPQGTEERPAVPFLSLHEADGSAWKKAAMDNIARFLETAQELPVIN